MSAYVITSVKNADMDQYRAEWQAAAQAVHDKVGAKMLARNDEPHVLAGNGHDGRCVVLFEFESADKAKEWWGAMIDLLKAKFMTDPQAIILEGVHGDDVPSMAIAQTQARGIWVW